MATSARVDGHTSRVKYIYNHENANKTGEICKNNFKSYCNYISFNSLCFYDPGWQYIQQSLFYNMFYSNDFERKCLRICFQKNEF